MKMQTQQLVATMCCFVSLGIGAFGLIAYAIHHPELTAFTNTVPISTPACVGLIALALAILLK